MEPTLVKPSLVANVIKKYEADIVGLNEVHEMGSIFNNQPEQIAMEAGYDYHYFAQAILDKDSPYGNAVLSKYPIIEAETIAIPAGSLEENPRCEARSIAKAIIDLNGQKVMVLVAHFGLADSEKKTVVNVVKKLVADAEYPCVLMGDLNMEPHETLIQKLKTILKDTAPEKIDKSSFTHSSDAPNRKIDYIFVDKSITVKNAEALDENPSDHRPYIANVMF